MGRKVIASPLLLAIHLLTSYRLPPVPARRPISSSTASAQSAGRRCYAYRPGAGSRMRTKSLLAKAPPGHALVVPEGGGHTSQRRVNTALGAFSPPALLPWRAYAYGVSVGLPSEMSCFAHSFLLRCCGGGRFC